MKRIHAFEFCESPWCPRFLRDSIVESLGRALRIAKTYEPVAPIFEEFCQNSNYDQILDLGSGTGEPISVLIDVIEKGGGCAPSFFISDLFPNCQVMRQVASRHAGKIQVIEESLDATSVPDKYNQQARTIISSFHHFNPTLAQKIIMDCVENDRALFIVEPFPRNIKYSGTLAGSFLIANLLNPFTASDQKLLKFLFTYLFPIIPLVSLWDGLVSICRMYSEDELMIMAQSCSGNYQWEYNLVHTSFGGYATTFSGIPNSEAVLNET